ncbi:MAG: cell surface protein [Planctomycetaceae bacterium]|nr:cell surface protein [Planctomycetaceae bacterium]
MTATKTLLRNLALFTFILTTAVSSAAELVEINVYPENIDLSNSRDRQRLIVQARFADGLTEDVTEQATLTSANSEVLRKDGYTFFPAADGETTVNVEYQGKAVQIPAKVQNAGVTPPISYTLDVMPVFLKANCNTGSCHGAARGKDGFRLSLYGFDVNGDYNRITRDFSSRRINLAFPEDSLLLTKGAGVVPHTGGTRFRKGDELYETVHEWLRDGAVIDQGEIPTVTKVEIYPKGAVLNGEGAQQKITVRAYYSDGTDRDVTHLAYFSSNNDNSAIIEQDGVVTAQNRGEAFIMARFDTHTVGTHFIVLPKNLEFAWNELPENNYIDTHMHNKFKNLRIIPSELCTDEEFIRRVTLDVTGRLPTVDEYNAFLADVDPKKRDKLVDELLTRKEFVEIWVMKWAELLTIRTTNQISYKSMLLYYTWLQERVANNVPMNVMVQELLGSNGGTFANAATNYYQNETNTLKVAENVAQVFMGMRMQCAQCHNHPFDRWTMDDYYSFAAFFSQIGRKRGEDPREIIVFNSGSGEVRHPVGNRVMAPKFLGGETPDVAGKDRRQVMANWLASDENPFFSQNLSNIVWAHFFGKGIIQEVDDVRISNPPVNKELLDALSQKLREYNYDFKKLVRDICTSRTYQLSTKTNETNEKDTTNFSHATLRRMRAEVLLDAITQVTTTSNKFPGLPSGARAVQIANGNTSTYFLTTFGRAKRETVCSCEVKMEPNLSQALHMLNGDTVNAKVTQGGLVATRLGEEVPHEKIVEEIYIRCLTRKPTEKELTNLMELVSQEENKQQALEDVFWALLNSREFVFNH